MGQQQLILLVLATVIVGIAIVVGIGAFTENSARANADALMQDAVRIANDAQASVKKPDPFGGVDTIEEVTWGVMGYPVTPTHGYVNLNGRFGLATTTGLVITAEGAPTTADSSAFEQTVVVAVCGPNDDDINGAITRINSQSTGRTAPSC